MEIIILDFMTIIKEMAREFCIRKTAQLFTKEILLIIYINEFKIDKKCIFIFMRYPLFILKYSVKLFLLMYSSNFVQKSHVLE